MLRAQEAAMTQQDDSRDARRALLRRAVALFADYRQRLVVIAALIVVSAGLGRAS